MGKTFKAPHGKKGRKRTKIANKDREKAGKKRRTGQ